MRLPPPMVSRKLGNQVEQIDPAGPCVGDPDTVLNMEERAQGMSGGCLKARLSG